MSTTTTTRPPLTQGQEARGLIEAWMAWKPATVTVDPPTVSRLREEAITLLVTGYPAEVVASALAALAIDHGSMLTRPFRVRLADRAWRWRCGRGEADRLWRLRITREVARIAAAHDSQVSA